MELTITITEQQAQLFLKGLGKLPLEESMELALTFKAECEKQISAAKEFKDNPNHDR